MNITIESFECPKSIRNYKKIMLGTSDAWWMSHLFQQTSEPVYYIVDCWITSHLQMMNRLEPLF